jgi:hypothetical protein
MHITAESSDNDNDIGGPRSKKRSKKKRKRTGAIPKSKSMMFLGEFFSNYHKLFSFTSTEWLNRGKGHRSSISAGGSLEHPELKVLPPVFSPMPVNHDKRMDDIPEDPGIVPGKDEIEMKQLKYQRANHSYSFVDGTISGASRMDGITEAEGDASLQAHQPERARRVASYLFLLDDLQLTTECPLPTL